MFFLFFFFFGHEACGILAPQPGTEPVLPAMEGECGSLNHWTARESLRFLLKHGADSSDVVWALPEWQMGSSLSQIKTVLPFER